MAASDAMPHNKHGAKCEANCGLVEGIQGGGGGRGGLYRPCIFKLSIALGTLRFKTTVSVWPSQWKTNRQ